MSLLYSTTALLSSTGLYLTLLHSTREPSRAMVQCNRVELNQVEPSSAIVEYNSRPVGRRGSRGFERIPLLTSKRSYTSKLHILSILPVGSGPLVSLLLRITAVQTSLHGCSYSTGVCEFVHGRPARNARITCLRRCDERHDARNNVRK